MDKYKRLISNTVIFAIGTFSSKVLVFLLMPLYTRVLTDAEYGVTDLIVQTGNRVPNPEGNLPGHQLLHCRPAACICPKQHSRFFISAPVLRRLPDRPGQMLRFLPDVGKLPEFHRFSIAPGCPEFLGKPLLIMSDQTSGAL